MEQGEEEQMQPFITQDCTKRRRKTWKTENKVKKQLKGDCGNKAWEHPTGFKVCREGIHPEQCESRAVNCINTHMLLKATGRHKNSSLAAPKLLRSILSSVEVRAESNSVKHTEHQRMGAQLSGAAGPSSRGGATKFPLIPHGRATSPPQVGSARSERTWCPRLLHPLRAGGEKMLVLCS